MPVRKYRSVEEMPQPPAPVRGSKDHWRRVAALWHRAAVLSRRRRPLGVRRFRAVDDPERIADHQAQPPAFQANDERA